MRRLTSILTVLIFFVESLGIDHLFSTIYASRDALRPAATLVSGIHDVAVKSSSAGKPMPKQFKPAKKGKHEQERETSVLFAAIFVAGVGGVFYLSLTLTGSILITFAATGITAVGLLAWFGMLKDVMMFIPRRIKKRLAAGEKRIKEEERARTKVSRQISRRGQKARDAEETQRLIEQANSILNRIFAENDPAKFKDYVSFKNAVEGAINTQLSEGHLTEEELGLKAIKDKIKSFLKKRRYFAERRAEEERTRRAKELAEARRDLAEKTVALQGAKDNVDKAIHGRLTREKERIAAFSEKLDQFKQKAVAELQRLKEESKRKMSEVNWRSFGGPDVYVGELAAAIAPEVKGDDEVKQFFEKLKTEGVKNIDQRNSNLLIICKDELSKIEPSRCRDKEDFFTGLGEIKKKFAILPNIDELIRQKAKEWDEYAAAEDKATKLFDIYTEELYTTERKTELQKARQAVEFWHFINSPGIPVTLRRKWLEKFCTELCKRYVQIADEQLNILREGRFTGRVAICRPVKIIEYILEVLDEQIKERKLNWLKPERKRITKELYGAKKQAKLGEEAAAEGEAFTAPGLAKEVKEAAEEVTEGILAEAEKVKAAQREAIKEAVSDEDVKEMLDSARGWFNKIKDIPEIAVTITECSEIYLILSDLEASGKCKSEIKDLKKQLLSRIMEIAMEWAKDPEVLDEKDRELLKGMPDIVICVYILAQTIDIKVEAAEVIWKEEAVPRAMEPLQGRRINPERLKEVMDKLAELGMFKKSKFRKEKGIIIQELLNTLGIATFASVIAVPFFVIRKIKEVVIDKPLPDFGPDNGTAVQRPRYDNMTLKKQKSAAKTAGNKAGPDLLSALQVDISQKASSAGSTGEKSMPAEPAQRNTRWFSLQPRSDVNIAVNSAA